MELVHCDAQHEPMLHVSGNFRGVIIVQGATKSVGTDNTCTEFTQDGFETVSAPTLKYSDIFICAFYFAGCEGKSCASICNECDGM